MVDKSVGMRNAEAADAEGREEEDYDAVVNRPEGQMISDFAAFMHMLKCSIGTGILFLPNAFKRTGYVMSIVCGVIVSLICTHTAVTLVQCAQELCRRNRIPMLDFAKTAELSFLSGPEPIRKYGWIFAGVTNVVICFVHFQTSVIYILYVASSFQQIIEFFSSYEMDIRVYIFIFFPFTCTLALIPNLKYLAPFSILGFLFLILGVSITFYYLLNDIPDPARLNLFTQLLPVPMYCSIFLFALHNMTLYLPLENTMKNPRHLPRLIAYSMLFNACLYISFGFLGYNKYENACDTVIKNLPIAETLAQMVKIAISLSVMFTFGLAYYVPVSILWPMIHSRIKANHCYEILFRLIGVTLTTLLAAAVPQMVPLLGLFSALSITTITLLVPALIETATKWHGAKRLLIIRNIGIAIVWVILLIFGTIEGALSIVREYGGVKEKGC